jgi:hypothetical protein
MTVIYIGARRRSYSDCPGKSELVAESQTSREASRFGHGDKRVFSYVNVIWKFKQKRTEQQRGLVPLLETYW